MTCERPAWRCRRLRAVAEPDQHLHALSRAHTEESVNVAKLVGHFRIFLQGLAVGMKSQSGAGGGEIHLDVGAARRQLIASGVAIRDDPAVSWRRGHCRSNEIEGRAV